MSSQIYYDRAFIRVGNDFAPVVCSGSNNCFEVNFRGREVPEKNWDVLNHRFGNRQVFSAEEIGKIADIYENIAVESGGGVRKTRYTAFEKGEFGRWIRGGMKSAHTVEEYTAWGNTVAVQNYCDPESIVEVTDTEDLLQTISEFEKKGKSFTVTFLGSCLEYR